MPTEKVTMPASMDSDRVHVDVMRGVRVPTADPKVELAVDVFRPVVDEPVPAVVSVYGYRKDLAGVWLEEPLRWFAERGYACVLAELRGIGTSDGVALPPVDPREGDDTVALIEWVSAQPWCTGNIGMWGSSYGGVLTLRTASRRPAALKAIIPMMNALDIERDFFHPGGIRGDLLPLAHWGGGKLIEQLLPPLLQHSSPQEQQRWLRRLQEATPDYLDLVTHPPGDPAWRDRVIDTAGIHAAALCVGGWRDIHPHATIRAYEQMSGPKKLLMGPWGHAGPQAWPVAPIDFMPMALRWWDHWLRGVDTGVMNEPPVAIYLQGHKAAWRSFESWPPAKTSRLEFRTATDLTLQPGAAQECVDTSTVIGVYQPDPTIGVLSGLWGLGFETPLDAHDDDMRALSATSPPLTRDLLLCGYPEVTVAVAGHGTAFAAPRRLVVRLNDVDAYDRSAFITGGVASSDSDTDQQSVELWPTSYCIRAGNRLRISISDADFPRLNPLPDPQPIPIAAINVLLPILPDDAGGPANVAEVPAPEAVAGSSWTITRDPIRHSAEFRMTTEPPAARIGGGHLLERHSDVRTTVHRTDPAASVTRSKHVWTVRMTTGEHVTASAEMYCTQTWIHARGIVEIDGSVVYSQDWNTPMDAG